MQKMEDNSISSILTDPPYGLKLMGMDWDHGLAAQNLGYEAVGIEKDEEYYKIAKERCA
jgi:DNA modification methylase